MQEWREAVRRKRRFPSSISFSSKVTAAETLRTQRKGFTLAFSAASASQRQVVQMLQSAIRNSHSAIDGRRPGLWHEKCMLYFDGLSTDFILARQAGWQVVAGWAWAAATGGCVQDRPDAAVRIQPEHWLDDGGEPGCGTAALGCASAATKTARNASGGG